MVVIAIQSVAATESVSAAAALSRENVPTQALVKLLPAASIIGAANPTPLLSEVVWETASTEAESSPIQ